MDYRRFTGKREQMQGVGTLPDWRTNGRAIFVSSSSRVAITSYSQHLMEMSGLQSLLEL